MNMRPLTVGLTVLTMMLWFAPANAYLTLKDYRAAKAAGGQRWQDAKLYVLGVGNGFGWANTELVLLHRPPVFCQPENLSLRGENFLDILDKALNDTAREDVKLRDDSPIEAVLLSALEATFPCKKM